MQTVSLHDLVTVEPGGGGLRVRCEGWETPQGEANICHRAAFAVLELLDAPDAGVAVDIEKRIPPCSGLGGGSADAAAVILGLPRALGRQITDLEALDVAEAVGADVPFFLTGGTTVVTGIGERLAPSPRQCELHFALARPDAGIETSWAYGLYDDWRAAAPSTMGRGAAAAVQKALEAGDVAAVAEALANAFWQPLSKARPELAELKRAIEATGALGVGLTGSGSCLFGIYDTEDGANRAAADLSERGYWATSAAAVDRGVAIVSEGGDQPLRLGSRSLREGP